MSNHTDDMPLHLRIRAVLKDYPQGLSTRDLANILCVAQYSVSPVVSKLHAYGAGIEKTGPNRGAGTKWRIREVTQTRPAATSRV